MTEGNQPQYLYLTTVGRKSGKPHRIEIWFVEHEGRYYLIHEGETHADWLKNVAADPHISFSLGSRDAPTMTGSARLVDHAKEPELAAAVKALMNAKYQWGDGQIVELKPMDQEGA